MRIDYSFDLSVNDKKLEKAVQAGEYDEVNPNITSKNFPSVRMKPDVRVDLACFSQVISTPEALEEFSKMGYRPANLPELLALGEKQPDMQLGFPMVTLDPVITLDENDNFCFPCLTSHGRRRVLDLVYPNSNGENGEEGKNWARAYRFAIVRVG